MRYPTALLKIFILFPLLFSPLFAFSFQAKERCMREIFQEYLPSGAAQLPALPPRSFEAGVTAEQLEQLRYALNAFAYNSFSDILSDRIQLQRSLVCVSEVHPLNFISTIFSDQELTNCLHKIREKQWLWRHVLSRVKKMLNEEADCDNLAPKYVQVFTDELKLECDYLLDLTVERKWNELVEHLFEQFPEKEHV